MVGLAIRSIFHAVVRAADGPISLPRAGNIVFPAGNNRENSQPQTKGLPPFGHMIDWASNSGVRFFGQHPLSVRQQQSGQRRSSKFELGVRRMKVSTENMGDPQRDTPVTRQPVTVLYSLVRPDGRTKYVDQLVDGLPADVTMKFFSWRAALRGRYDVFHMHWPELTLRGSNPLRRFLRRRAADVFVTLLAIRRIPLVRTVHNMTPHEEGSRAENRTLARLNRRTNLFIRLNPTTDVPFDAPVVTILHGHYRDQFAKHPMPPSRTGRILYFGIIRPYKGVAELMSTFTSIADDGIELRIVGSPSTGQREIVEAACVRDPRITSRLVFVDDADLVDEIGQAELIVLPYKEMHNSGSILVAMSLGRPVLAPITPANSALAAEVGPGWIHGYEGELTASVLVEALEAVRRNPPVDARPRLDGRDWKSLGVQHYDAYRRAIAELRGAGDD
jgi:beta-1,4-mannosyltransferase